MDTSTRAAKRDRLKKRTVKWVGGQCEEEEAKRDKDRETKQRVSFLCQLLLSSHPLM